tara:strand:- start:6 stop:725 length:720 start_codon:yes stop_codon:yes gene_type:complete
MTLKLNQFNEFDFRIDDIGASSKIYERYSKFPILGNVGFLKNRKILGNWGPYNELNAKEIDKLILIMHEANKKLAVAVTAAWILPNNNLIPFNKKFPEQAKILKEASQNRLITILNHGLSHCVIGLHMPRLLSSNRKYHREFVDLLPEFIHKKHILMSQEILEEWIESPINILAPPGNCYSLKTVKACEDTNIKYIHASRNMVPKESSINYLNLGKCVCFHDREIKLYGEQFLYKLLKK